MNGIFKDTVATAATILTLMVIHSMSAPVPESSNCECTGALNGGFFILTEALGENGEQPTNETKNEVLCEFFYIYSRLSATLEQQLLLSPGQENDTSDLPLRVSVVKKLLLDSCRQLVQSGSLVEEDCISTHSISLHCLRPTMDVSTIKNAIVPNVNSPLAEGIGCWLTQFYNHSETDDDVFDQLVTTVNITTGFKMCLDGDCVTQCS